MGRRLAREHEVPKYGDVWAWDHGEPMMAVVDTRETLPGLPLSRRHLFVRLTTGTPALVKMWAGMNSHAMWTVLDDD